MTSRSARRRRSPARLGLAFLLVLGAPELASAQPSEPIELEWNAPAECPRVEVVRARIRKLAGPPKSKAQPLHAEATITRNDDGGLHLRLLVRSGSLAGERNMDGKTCSGLAGAAAVTLVLLLNASEPLTEQDLAGANAADSATKGRDATAHAASNTAPAIVERQGPSSKASEADHQPQRRWHLLLQLPQIELGVGPLHQPSLGLAVAAGVSFDRWRFLAKGSRWFPQHSSANDAQQQYGADIDRTSATLLACRAAVLSWVELAPCMSLTLQHISARGTGAHIGARTGTVTWFAASVGAQGRARITPWFSLFLGLDGQIQMSQPLLSVDQIGPVERLLPAALITTLGSEWIF